MPSFCERAARTTPCSIHLAVSFPPFTLAKPDHCSSAGTFFWIVGSQTVSYKLCGVVRRSRQAKVDSVIRTPETAQDSPWPAAGRLTARLQAAQVARVGAARAAVTPERPWDIADTSVVARGGACAAVYML